MKKILVIEDNAEIRDNIAEILVLASYEVSTAENGKTGIETALQQKPDLIICDIMMPVLDGYGVLHLLQKNGTIRNTPFIFLTAKSERAELRRAMELGADDYITKPFEETELLKAVESRLKKAEQVKQEYLAGKTASRAAWMQDNSINEVLQWLSENRDTSKYKRKQVIYSEGNRPYRLFYIQKGKVKLYKSNDDGKELIVDLYKEGDFLGYAALLEGTTYKETAEAMEDAELALIPKEDFEELMNTDNRIARKFISMLANKLMEKEKQLVGLAYNSLRKKVADALLILRKKYSSVINISRENLAAIAGTATESLIRTLSDFKNEKLIDINDRSIVILNEKKLEDLIN